MEQTTELEILKAVASGDETAFEWLFFQYQPRLVRFLTGLTHDSEVGHDMAQDLFLSLWTNRMKLTEIKSFSSYLFQMARFTVYNYFDRLALSEKYEIEYLIKAATAESEEEFLFVKELRSVIDKAVETMSPQRQRVYRMSREEGLPNDEIAVRLAISKRTVENHLTAALSVLRKIIYLWAILS